MGGGLALGKEGPLVHTGACIASLLGQVRTHCMKYSVMLEQLFSILRKQAKFLSVDLGWIHEISFEFEVASTFQE